MFYNGSCGTNVPEVEWRATARNETELKGTPEMSKPCSVCRHPLKAEIDRALLAREPLRRLAEQYSLSPTSLHRHRGKDIAKGLSRAVIAQELAHDGDLLEQVKNLISRAQGILDEAEMRSDPRTALAAVRELRGTFELLARLTGKFDVVAPEVPRRPLFQLPLGCEVSVKCTVKTGDGV